MNDNSQAATVEKSVSTTSQKTRGVTPKYFVNIGVFSAIYFVVVFAGGMVGLAGPWFMFVGFIISILINGAVVMLYLVKTPVFGALTIMGLITSVLMVLTGHVWYMIPFSVAFGLIGDLIVRSGNSRSRWRNIFAYGFITTWYMVPLLPIVFNADAYFADIATQMGQAYTDQMRALVQPWFVFAWGGVAFIIGIIGGWLGSKILVKHFAKAGIV